MTLPANLATLRDRAMQTSCESWAMRQRWPLARGIDRAGPCPLCGGKDRFSIHTKKNTFLCRKCDLKGAGVIDLVMQTKRVGFVEACEMITGTRLEQQVDPAEAERARKKAEAQEAKRAEENERYRERARRAGYDLWTRSRRFDSFGADSEVRSYLELRGIEPERLLSLGVTIVHELSAHPYRHEAKKGQWVTLLAGSAMVLPIRRADGAFGAAHQTWIDLSQPKGRAVLVDAKGKPLSSKKMLGSKMGGAIRIFTPPHPRRLVIGEGFETTATPLVHAFEADTAYWAAGDVGNMAGKAFRDAKGHQVMDEPDMTDSDAFMPPEWCEELVFLGEGDEGDINRQKLTRGLRRAMRARPGLKGFFVPAPGPGEDLNDLVRNGAMARGEAVEK